ncbi:DUF2318 domain-containing protein [Lachnospiraceae bacterium 54-53]
MICRLQTQNKERSGKKPFSRKKKRTAFAVTMLTVAAVAALTACSFSGKAGETGSSSAAGQDQSQGQSQNQTQDQAQSQSQAEAEGQDLVIPVKDISDTASFYPVSVDGTQMEVIAVKAPDGTIRTAFNTCQVCYDSGRGYYKQDGDTLVCQNCGNRFPMSRVEVEAGGCNPWPVFDKNKTVTEDSITISYDFLKESRQIFANWKGSY